MFIFKSTYDYDDIDKQVFYLYNNECGENNNTRNTVKKYRTFIFIVITLM